MLKTAIKKAAIELCYKGNPRFSADDLSVVFCFILEDLLRTHDKDEVWNAVSSLLVERETIIPVKADVDIFGLLGDSEYISRVLAMAFDRLNAGPEAPALRISPSILSNREMDNVLGDNPSFALIFGTSPIFFQDTVMAWHLDEASFCLKNTEGGNSINILGIHHDWLNGSMEASEALLIDDTGMVKSVRFSRPVKLNYAHITELMRDDEHDKHKELSNLCRKNNIEMLNPYSASINADDKYLCHQILKKYNEKIDTPEAFLIRKDAAPVHIDEILKEFINREALLYVQPNMGTEGRLVKAFKLDESTQNEIIEHIALIHQTDDALIRESRGNVCYFDENKRELGYRRITFRVHVAWSGVEYIAESGYAQVAADQSTMVASRGREGAIVPISKAIDKIYYHSGQDGYFKHYILSKNDLVEIKNVAISAAKALNESQGSQNKLEFMGLDMLLEITEDYNDIIFKPVVLEINPRLAGLNHSTPLDPSSDKAYISEAVFKNR